MTSSHTHYQPLHQITIIPSNNNTQSQSQSQSQPSPSPSPSPSSSPSSHLRFQSVDRGTRTDSDQAIDNQLMRPFVRSIKHGTWKRNLILLFVIIASILIFLTIKRNSSSNRSWFPSTNQQLTTTTTLSNNDCHLPPGYPAHRYALMIDAGSTGSRIHVYRFSYCQPNQTTTNPSATILPTLDHELFFKTLPGLSSYAGRPNEAAESLRPLLQAALEGVPAQQRHCTPISVKATAGLRLLGQAKSKEILDEIQRWLATSWPFRLAKDNPVAIMDGADEGVYAWVTINYLLKTIGASSNDSKKKTTAAVMDLGGASTQIVFEPLRSKLEPGEHVYELSFGGQRHALYQHSHLGYGLMEARRAVHQLVAYSELWRKKISWNQLAESGPIGNPCLQPQSTRQVKLSTGDSLQSTDQSLLVDFIGSGGGFEACRRIAEVVIGKDSVCNLKPCAFAGVYQPSFRESFSDGPIYALSYFYDRLYPLGIKKKFKLKELEGLIRVICDRKYEKDDRLKQDDQFKEKLNELKHQISDYDFELDEVIAELDDRPETCLDLTFIFSILRLGYQVDPDREIIISKKIAAIELGWSLGAGIDLLEKNSIEGC